MKLATKNTGQRASRGLAEVGLSHQKLRNAKECHSLLLSSSLNFRVKVQIPTSSVCKGFQVFSTHADSISFKGNEQPNGNSFFKL